MFVRPAQDKFVSSANIEAVVVCKHCGRSLIYIRNSKGPRFEPCGTPQYISVSLYTVLLLILQICFLSCKYDWNHCRAVPRIPQRSSLDKSILWSTVSNAFLRSRKTTPLIKPLSILVSQLFVKCSSVVSVEWLERKPDWFLTSTQKSK